MAYLLDPAVPDADQPGGVLQDLPVMGWKKRKAGSLAAVDLPHQVEHRLPVSDSRLAVGSSAKTIRAAVTRGPGDRDPLLLSAGSWAGRRVSVRRSPTRASMAMQFAHAVPFAQQGQGAGHVP